ncbi:MAG: FG-GAP and VCBS repeat-containing protein [Chloroflexota bacterium]
MSQRPLLLLLTLLGLLQSSPLKLQAWRLAPEGLQTIPLPSPSTNILPSTKTDFQGDGHLEMLTLNEGQAAILSNDHILWESPAHWQVTQATLSDLNNDGQPEAALLLWRPFQPWPVDRWLPHGGRINGFHNQEGMSCHLILIAWRNGKFKELWAGSALAEPIKSFAATDLNGDGKQELVTLEGNYTDTPFAPANALKVWEWNGFGFTLIDHISGRYRQFQIVLTQENAYIILISH